MSPSASPAQPRRRQLLLAAAVTSATPWWLSGCATPGSVDVPDSTEAGRQATLRAVNRMTWGANGPTLQTAWHSGYERYVTLQLAADPTRPMPAEVQTQIDALRIQKTSLVDLLQQTNEIRKNGNTLATEEERKEAQKAYQEALNQLGREAATRHLLRAVYSDRQLLEHMNWFWLNHFNVHQYKGNVRAMLGDYEERALRPHALGRFRDLLGAVAHHPAMLRYLDNEQNASQRLNENYARELLELHTMGVNGGYTQRDVQEMARVLTGFGISSAADSGAAPPKIKPELAALYRREGAFEFNPGRHDFGEKVVLGHTIRAKGAAELDEVLDLVAVHPSTARFLSTRMATFLLADEPPPALVDRMTRTYLASDGQIAATLRVLLMSDEFRAPESQSAKFKDPMHFVVSAMRASYEDRVVLNTAPMQSWLARMGQSLYNRQTPDGYPLTAAAWSGSGQLSTRFEIARTVGAGAPQLFKSADSQRSDPAPARPQLAMAAFPAAMQGNFGTDTRSALAQATSPTEWNALFLSSPEFMYR